MKGAWASRARRREISVLPTPVGPIIRIFLWLTPRRSSGGSCWRRPRLRSATATARLASFWPTIWRSSSETISRGEKLVSVISVCLSWCLVEQAHHHVFVDIATVHVEAAGVGAVDIEARLLIAADGRQGVRAQHQMRLQHFAAGMVDGGFERGHRGAGAAPGGFEAGLQQPAAMGLAL